MTKVRRSALAAGLVVFALGSGAAQSQGVTKTTILIGHSGPLSGANKEFGEDIRDGALAYFNKGAVDESHEACQRAIELDPENWIGHWTLGRIHYATGHADEAIAVRLVGG